MWGLLAIPGAFLLLSVYIWFPYARPQIKMHEETWDEKRSEWLRSQAKAAGYGVKDD